MRIRHVTFGGSGRRILTATTLAALFTGASLMVAGTASAAVVLSTGCTGSVTGKMGDQVAVSGPALQNLVRQSAQETVTLLSLLTVQPDTIAQAIAQKSVIQVGQIPQQSGGTVSGNAIGAAVASALSGANGLGLLPSTRQNVLDHIQQRVAGSCGLTTIASNYPTSSSTAPSSTVSNPAAGNPSTQPKTNSNTTPGQSGSTATGTGTTTGNQSGTGTGESGSATPPGTRYPSDGTQAGSPGQQFTIVDNGSQPAGPDIHNTGQAQALNSTVSSDTLQLPILLAVLALAGVSAALVRTWVLKRT